MDKLRIEILEAIIIILISLVIAIEVHTMDLGLDKALAIIVLGPIGWVLLTRYFG